MRTRHGAALSRVLAAASFLVDGVAVRDRSIVLSDGAGLDVLPPFAGG
jgi:sulfur-carrier protein